MKKPLIPRAALLGSLLLFSFTVGAVDGPASMSRATPEAAARCQADPVKCEEMKQRVREYRKACKQDPAICKQRRKEVHRKMKAFCDANPEQCKQKAKAFCEANPEKCRELKERHGRKAWPTPAAAEPAAAPETMMR